MWNQIKQTIKNFYNEHTAAVQSIFATLAILTLVLVIMLVTFLGIILGGMFGAMIAVIILFLMIAPFMFYSIFKD